MIIFLSLCVIAACSSEPPRRIYTTILVDQTSEDGQRVTSDMVKSYAQLPELTASMYFSIMPLNESVYNQHYGVYISVADVGLGYDEMSRKSVVDDYYEKVDSLLTGLDTLTYGRPKSTLFRAVLAEARFLMEQDCDERKLIIFSDLEENNEFFSYQKPAHQKMLRNPELLTAHFEGLFELSVDESFEGLVIEIHHVPSQESEAVFESFLNLYIAVFGSRGAVVKHEFSTIQSIAP